MTVVKALGLIFVVLPVYAAVWYIVINLESMTLAKPGHPSLGPIPYVKGGLILFGILLAWSVARTLLDRHRAPCPYCREMIVHNASVCRYCGTNLD